MNLLASTSALSMAAFSVVFFLIATEDDFIIGLCGGLFMLLLSLFFAYIFIFAGVLKKFYIEITSEYIKVFSLFKPRLAYWRDVHGAQAYEINNNLMIALFLEKDIRKAKKRSLSNSLNSLLGYPGSSFQIPLNYFKEIDVERLLLIIDEQINRNALPFSMFGGALFLCYYSNV